MSHTNLQAAEANAKATIFWTLRWLVPAEPWPKSQTPMTLSGTASESNPTIDLPEKGGCLNVVTANNNAREQIGAPYANMIMLPVPLLIGSAAQTCYAKPDGGTYWFGLDSNGHSVAEMNKVWYATAPYDEADPKVSCVPVQGSLSQTVTADGDTATLLIGWTGRVFIEVNGQKNESCLAPPLPAPTPGHTRNSYDCQVVIGAAFCMTR